MLILIFHKVLLKLKNRSFFLFRIFMLYYSRNYNTPYTQDILNILKIEKVFQIKLFQILKEKY